MGQPMTERYSPIVVAAGATVAFSGNAIGGYLCKTAGTIVVTSNPADGKPATVLLNGYPVAAGFNKIPMYVGANGGTLVSTTTDGTLLVV